MARFLDFEAVEEETSGFENAQRFFTDQSSSGDEEGSLIDFIVSDSEIGQEASILRAFDNDREFRRHCSTPPNSPVSGPSRSPRTPKTPDRYQASGPVSTPSPKKNCRGSLAKNWCFTLNNYTDEEYQKIIGITECHYLIVGKEIGDKEKTPHLQGYIQMDEKKRFNPMKDIIGRRAHLSVARGTPEQNKKYCSKGGDFFEKGSMMTRGAGKADEGGGGGKLHDCVMAALGGAPHSALLAEFGGCYVHNMKKVNLLAAEIRKEKHRQDLTLEFAAAKLRPWQQALLDEMNSQKAANDRRTVNYVYDDIGNKGKSWFCDYCLAKFGFDDVIVLDNGRTVDLTYLYNGQWMVFFDVARSAGNINYEVVEKVKNGRMISAKYETQLKIFKRPIIVVIFSNVKPDITQLSRDRWQIYQITELGTLLKVPTLDFIIDV